MSGVRPPQPGGAVPRPVQILDEIKMPEMDVIAAAPPEGTVASGLMMKTDKGWHPIFVSKKKITS
jgi:hypothetical protein